MVSPCLGTKLRLWYEHEIGLLCVGQKVPVCAVIDDTQCLRTKLSPWHDHELDFLVLGKKVSAPAVLRHHHALQPT